MVIFTNMNKIRSAIMHVPLTAQQLLVWAGIGLLYACTGHTDNGTPQITYVTEADFSDTTQNAIELAEGLRIDLWAPGPLLHNAVAISLDHQGVAYVSETERRKSSDLDIREHRDWIPEDLSLQSLEQTEAFHKRKLDPALSDQNTWLEDFNADGSHDWRDLLVQSERVRRIWDEDGNGRADASNVFAAGFNGLLTGVAAGVLADRGYVYVTAAPDLWRLRDVDGDGDADERISLSHGYGIHIAYAGHDMSGLVKGPDGKIYWSIGDMGVNVVDQQGKRWAYPNEGAVMRCNPDGSEFEVFAHGLRNPQELAFDEYGNLISVDNDGDHPGEHERYVHIIEGSDSGWRINWQYGKYEEENEAYKVWMDEGLHLPHFPGRPAYVLPPLALAPDGPAGLAYNPGTALDTSWNHYFFSSFFKASAARSLVQAFRLAPKGASFKVVEQKKAIGGIVPTGLAFGPDGALYVLDWKEGYDKKPEGRVWRLDVKHTSVAELRAHTRQILAEGMLQRTDAELKSLLEYPDMRVRMEAQFELVDRNKGAELLAVAQQGGTLLARLHGIWGYGQLGRSRGADCGPLLPLLTDAEPEVRAQAARVLGENHYQPAVEQLVQQLQNPSARAQFFAAEALGKLGNKAAFQPLVDLLQATGDADPHLRHAVVYALSRLGDVQALAALAGHQAEAVRLGAVVALRELKAPQLAVFLKDPSPLVVVEAARAIHDDQSVEAALPALAQALLESPVQDEAFIRRAVNANLRLGDAASARRLYQYAQNSRASEDMRSLALWALGYWPQPPTLDRVDNHPRQLSPQHDPQAALALAPDVLPAILRDPSPRLRAAAAGLSGRIGFKAAEPQLLALFKEEQQPLEVRTAALTALARLQSSHIDELLQMALASPQQQLRETALDLMPQLELPSEIVADMMATLLQKGSTPEQQKALALLGSLDHPKAADLLAAYLAQLQAATLKPELQLDLIMAIEKSHHEGLKSQLAAYLAQKPADDVLAQYRETLYGGNVQRGRRIFYRNNAAQCIRCHQINGLGGEVGPDLTHIGSTLSREELLASLVMPSARLAPGYGTVMLTLKDNSTLVGTVAGEQSGQVTLRLANGEAREVLLVEVSNRQDAPSAMPGMQSLLSKAEIRDLVAFLSTLE